MHDQTKTEEATKKCKAYGDFFSIVVEDINQLAIKEQSYGFSWRNRGGVGAFMMLARKWDRLEQQCKEKGYDIFTAVLEDSEGINTKDGVIDDIRDLRRYLVLVEQHLVKLSDSSISPMQNSACVRIPGPHSTLVSNQQRPHTKEPIMPIQAITIKSLTSNEICATRALYKNCLSNMGGKNIESLRNDSYTWVDVSDLVKAGWTIPEAKGTFGALLKKGVIEDDGEDTSLNIDEEMNEVFDYLDQE